MTFSFSFSFSFAFSLSFSFAFSFAFLSWIPHNTHYSYLSIITYLNTTKTFYLINSKNLPTQLYAATVPAILVIIFWNFGIIYYRSDPPQVKLNLISSTANLIYKLPHELPNDLRCRILGN